MATPSNIPMYVVGEQTATLVFTKKGAIDPATGKPEEIPVLWMKVKADLTFDDRKRLWWTNEDLEDQLDEHGEPMTDDEGKVLKKPLPDEEVRDRLAPFVLEWGVGIRDESGTTVPAPPPAEAGGGQFALIADEYVRLLLRDLRMRSTGKVDTDFLAG